MRWGGRARPHVWIALVAGVLLAAVLPQAATAQTFTVSSTANVGLGSLRKAILDANAHAGTDTIRFSIGSGSQTIPVPAPLADITDPVRIDGSTQPGFAGVPLIILDGGGAVVTGLHIVAGSSFVRALQIRNFTGTAIQLDTGGFNRVVGNFIGTDGTSAFSNATGVAMVTGSQGNVIGGAGGARNLISGNLTDVLISGPGASFNRVQGNFIGPNAAGISEIAGGIIGVSIANGATENVIGGPSGRNVISGSSNAGVLITDVGTSRNVVQGNFIGTNAAGGEGSFGAQQRDGGVHILNGASSNLIGGPSPRLRNVISFNNESGINIEGVAPTAAHDNVVQGNFIGTDKSGTKDLGNGEAGVSLADGAFENTIGGTSRSSRNIISGNSEAGVQIQDQASRNRIIGNFIGPDVKGRSGIGNDTGILVEDGAPSSEIGGELAGRGNRIAFNVNDGIAIQVGFGPAPSGQAILRNSIESNGGVGISEEATTNGDEPAPTITTVTHQRRKTIITGTAAAGSHRIELFSNTACDPSTAGEGKVFRAAVSVVGTTWTITLGRTSAGTIWTATETNLGTRNTSPFSLCFP